jgi:hypothetical protein
VRSLQAFGLGSILGRLPSRKGGGSMSIKKKKLKTNEGIIDFRTGEIKERG